MASRKHGTLYIGVTSDLVSRVWQHREGVVDGFTTRYGLKMLVYYEAYDAMDEAIVREKKLKQFLRKWKIELIEKHNPEWQDLYADITG